MTTDGPEAAFRRERMKTLIAVLVAICAILLVVDVWIHKHGPFRIEHAWGFYAWVGVLAGLVAVGFGLVAAVILRRGEDYYDG